MKPIKKLFIQNYKNFLMALVCFILIWHTFSVISYVNFTHDTLKTNISSSAGFIESKLLNNSIAELTEKLKTYLRDYEVSLEFNTKLVSSEWLSNYKIGQFGEDDEPYFISHFRVENNGLELGEFKISYNLSKINYAILHQNILLYGFIALSFILIILWANYPTLKIMSLLNDTISEIDQNVNLTNVSESLSFIENKLKDIRNTNRSEDVLLLIQKLKDILTRQEELQLDAQRSQVIADVSRKVAHDIRSPLSVLNILASKPELMQENILIFKQAYVRIHQICEELLSAKPKTVAFCENKESQVDILKSILEILNEKQIEYDGKNLKLEIINNSTISKVQGQEKELKAILSNLINNSIEASSQKPMIHISIRVINTEANVLLIVEDQGKGISDSQLAKVFGKGFTSRKNGHGLGLYNAKNLIQSWGGSIVMTSKEFVGTKVFIKLKTAS